jgi:hypothetical protein
MDKDFLNLLIAIAVSILIGNILVGLLRFFQV